MAPKLTLPIVALGTALALSPAQAGPPEILTLTETPFGYGPGVLFLIRSTWDNIGLHDGSRDDVFFVTRNLATGAETVEHLRAINRIADYDRDPTGNRWTITEDTPETVPAPFAVRATSGALPWAAVVVAPPWMEPSATLDDTALTVTFHDETRSLPTEAVFAAMDRIINATADALPHYHRMSTQTGTDALRGRSFDVTDCGVEEILRAMLVRSDPPLALARVSCEIEETDQTSVLVALPPP